jgi:hypothetical protein
MVSFAEDHGEHEFYALRELFPYQYEQHIVAYRQGAGRLQVQGAFHFTRHNGIHHKESVEDGRTGGIFTPPARGCV